MALVTLLCDVLEFTGKQLIAYLSWKQFLSFSKIITKSSGFVLSFSTPGLYQGVQAVVKNSNVITKKKKKDAAKKKQKKKNEKVSYNKRQITKTSKDNSCYFYKRSNKIMVRNG